MTHFDWQLDDLDEGDDYPHGPRTPHDHRRQWLECPECGYVWSMDALCTTTPADQRCSGCVQRASGTGPHVTDPGPICYKGADPFGKER